MFLGSWFEIESHLHENSFFDQNDVQCERLIIIIKEWRYENRNEDVVKLHVVRGGGGH